MRLRIETRWPETKRGYIFAALFDSSDKSCCERPVCKADAWIVGDEETKDMTAIEMAKMIIAALEPPIP